MSKDQAPLIRLKDINKHYPSDNKRINILHHLNLDIYSGEFIMIMGKSGSGKTTLLNILGFLDKFNEGEYLFKEQNVTNLNEKQRSIFRNENIGFIFQQFNLIETLNVYQNVELPMVYKGSYTREERKKIIEEKLRIVGLADKIYRKPSQLSGGQQQRIAIARALVNDAEIIFADEPTGALDSETCDEVMELLASLNKQGKTILMVTHDHDLLKYATRIITLKNGIFVNEAFGGVGS